MLDRPSQDEPWIGARLAALLLILSGGAGGCATSSPSPAAQSVVPVSGVPGPRCENKGTVIGESESRMFGSTGDQLIAEATREAMEKAAALGATHIFLSPVTLRSKQGAPVSATLTGVAFRCPPAVP
jgi:Domain of unknown function (DUF4156)